MKKIIIFYQFILTFFLGPVVPNIAIAYSPFVDPPASYLLQVNGRTYRERGVEIRRAPASLTKVMTALLILEQCDLDDVVRVSASAAAETGSRIGLRKGERLKVRDLLAATLIASANDACRALAEHAAGSQKKFVTMMNNRAIRLGMRNTKFANASGHDQVGHYSSSLDLLILAKAALQHETFSSLVAVRMMRISTLNGNRSFFLRNKNRLIGTYRGAKGIKTGTTPNAGQCLIALAERGETRVLLVMLRSKNRWRVAPAMLDAAFASYSTDSKEE